MPFSCPSLPFHAAKQTPLNPAMRSVKLSQWRPGAEPQLQNQFCHIWRPGKASGGHGFRFFSGVLNFEC